jgi:site-specific recombinase XerD
MPRVFTGKVVIPGDQIEAYLQALTAGEKAREPFRRYLEGLKDEFAADLATTYARKTVTKHVWIVEMFVEFLCRQTDVERIEEITRGMVNTHFRQWYRRKVLDSATPDDLRVALKRFFQFLETRKGIDNPKVRDALQ